MNLIHRTALYKFALSLCMVAALLLGVTSFTGRTQDSPTPQLPEPERRKINDKSSKNLPVVIREVRNVNKEKDWFRDMEIEIKNVSRLPIYYVALMLEFPDIPTDSTPGLPNADGIIPARVVTGLTLDYGNPRLINVMNLAGPEDTPLNPGETYIFKVPEQRVPDLESTAKRKNVRVEDIKDIIVELNTVSFGDGTGFIAGRFVDYKKKE
jgi:hypothetical protein